MVLKTEGLNLRPCGHKNKKIKLRTSDSRVECCVQQAGDVMMLLMLQ